jgi:hypothetical protein
MQLLHVRDNERQSLLEWSENNRRHIANLSRKELRLVKYNKVTINKQQSIIEVTRFS